jgi:PAS domain S-box-containing protein
VTEDEQNRKNDRGLLSDSTRPPDPARLRRWAEEKAKAIGTQDVEPVSPEQAGRTVHELRVHQIELEMQNEELRRLQEVLEAQRARYFDLYDLAPIGYLTVSQKGFVLEVNLTAATLLGVARADLLKRLLSGRVLPEDQDILYRHRKQLLETGEPQVFELRMVRKDGAPFWARLHMAVAQAPDNGTSVCRCAFSDITDVKRAEGLLQQMNETLEQRVVQRTAALKEAQEYAERLIDTAQVIVLVLDLEGRIVRINEYMERLSGYQLAEVQGKDWFSTFLPDHDRELAGALFEKAVRGVPTRGNVNSIVTKDGHERLIEWYDTPLKHSDGHNIGLLAIGQDVTERKQIEMKLRQSEERYRSLVENINLGISIIDRDYRIQLMNSVQAGMNHSRVEKYIGKECFRLLEKRDSVCVHCPGTIAMATGKPADVETRGIRDDGSSFPVRVMAFPLFDPKGSVTGFIEVVEDITGRKNAEAEMAKAKDAAEAANRAKSEFLANMSHEIRTPLTAILGFSDLLATPDIPQSEQNEYVEGIQRNAKSLLALIGDILDLSKIEAERMTLERTDWPLREIIDSAVAAVQVQAERKGLSVRVDYSFPLPEVIHTDPGRLRQILVNLLGNAVKFTMQGSVVLAVRCRREAQGLPRLQFAVSDTGIGMPAERFDRLFKPFTQLDGSTSRRFGGTGLGLCISKRLAQALGGDIDVESEIDKGSVFTVTIDPNPLSGDLMLQAPGTGSSGA